MTIDTKLRDVGALAVCFGRGAVRGETRAQSTERPGSLCFVRDPLWLNLRKSEARRECRLSALTRRYAGDRRMRRIAPLPTCSGVGDRRRARLRPRLIELDHIRPGRLQVADLCVDRRGVIDNELFLVPVEFVLTPGATS
jgi:hypothetical protein